MHLIDGQAPYQRHQQHCQPKAPSKLVSNFQIFYKVHRFPYELFFNLFVTEFTDTKSQNLGALNPIFYKRQKYRPTQNKIKENTKK
jgi:hypothetical protein